MTTRTYTVMGVGSVGPAHPSYNPAVSVTLVDEGQGFRTVTQPNSRAGHRFALEQGYALDESQAEIALSVWYQDLVAEVGAVASASVHPVPAPAEITYTVTGKGSVGPAHPSYNPAVTVALRKDGETIERVTHPNGRAGHRWAIGKGYALDACQADLAERPWYQDLLADARYERSGL